LVECWKNVHCLNRFVNSSHEIGTIFDDLQKTGVIGGSASYQEGELMHIPGVIIAILIGGVLFDLDAWGIALAIFFAGLFGALLYGGGL
jgi:hypothetical protein